MPLWLAYLTAHDFLWSSRETPNTPVGENGPDGARPKEPDINPRTAELAEEGRAIARRQASVVCRLIDPDSLGRKLDASDKDAGTRLVDVLKAWRTCHSAAVFIETAGELPIAPLAWKNTDWQAWQSQLEQQAKTLRDFSAKQKMVGSNLHLDDFLAFLQKQAAEVDNELCVTETLLDVNKAWKAEQYLECYQKCKTVAVPNIRDLETRSWLREKMDAAQDRASYRNDKDLLVAELGSDINVDVDVLAPESASKQLERIGKFLQQHRTVPETLPLS